MKKILLVSAVLFVGCGFIRPSKKTLVTIIKDQQQYIFDLRFQMNSLKNKLNKQEEKINYLDYKLDSITKQLKK